jgi:hypothetical protein
MNSGVFYSSFVLSGSLPVHEAIARLKLHAPRTRVVVRRQLGFQLLFYAFTVEELLGRLSPTQGELPLVAALALREEDAVPATEPGEKVRGAVSVVLEGEQVVGVIDATSVPPPRRTAPPAAPAAPPIPPPAAARPPATTAPHHRSAPRAASAEDRAETHDKLATQFRFDRTRGYDLAVGDAAVEPEEVSEPEPERLEAFPFIDAPSRVAPREQFDVTIGLSQTAAAEVVGGKLSVPVPAGAKTIDLSVVVAADGFEALDGWHRTLTVQVAQPDAARVAVRLRAPPLLDGQPLLSFLVVHFSSNGEACGMASRKIVVRNPHETEIPTIGNGRQWLDDPATTAAITFDPSQTPPDLTIRLAKPDQDDGSGKFVLTFESPHPLAIPDPGTFGINLGQDVQTFARVVVERVNQNADRETIGLALRGMGSAIADTLPDALGVVLKQVWDKAQSERRIPTLLLLSAEAYVPWELALLDPPPDPTRPPFLGAQFAMSRWVLGARNVPLPPPREITVRRMAVVAGDYKSAQNLRPLPEAMAEGELLAQQYRAIPLKATARELTALLEGELPSNGEKVGVDAIHFACHGAMDPENPFSGRIYLDDASLLSSDLFRSAAVGRTNGPFLFLNACQVAQAGELLNEYGGFAGSSLRAGFRGFVAPLWNVSDVVARDIALEFYERAFTAGGRAATPVASILRDIRAKYLAKAGATPQATYMAYVFYGHPNLVLSRQE